MALPWGSGQCQQDNAPCRNTKTNQEFPENVEKEPQPGLQIAQNSICLGPVRHVSTSTVHIQRPHFRSAVAMTHPGMDFWGVSNDIWHQDVGSGSFLFDVRCEDGLNGPDSHKPVSGMLDEFGIRDAMRYLSNLSCHSWAFEVGHCHWKVPWIFSTRTLHGHEMIFVVQFTGQWF